MRGFGRIPDSPRPVGYGSVVAQLQTRRCHARMVSRGDIRGNVGRTSWPHCTGMGLSERLILEEWSRLLYAFLISVVEQRGDRESSRARLGLPEQASLVSIGQVDVSRGSMGAGRPWS